MSPGFFYAWGMVRCLQIVIFCGLTGVGASAQAERDQVFDEQGAALFDALVGQQFRQLTSDLTRRTAITRKLNEQMIEEVELKDVKLQDVIAYVAKMSRDLDPENQGINLVVTNEARAAAGDSTTSLSLRRVPLAAVLRYAVQALGVRYYVDEYAVVIDQRQAVARPTGSQGESARPARPVSP